MVDSPTRSNADTRGRLADGDIHPRTWVVVIAAAMLLVPGVALLRIDGGPRNWLLFPFPIIVLVWTIGPIGIAALAVAFLGWSFHVFLGRPTIPTRSLVVFGVLVAATYWWFHENWELGVQFQGHPHASTVLAANVVVAIVLLELAVSGRRRPRFWVGFAFHWLMFFWLAWYAFPWFGELP